MGQCQEGSVAIGNAIENSEGEGIKTIEYLQEYYKLLFSLAEALQRGKKIGLTDLK